MQQSKVLVDTSVWILALRADGPLFIRQEIDRLLAENRIAINGIILLELLQGAKDQKEYHQLEEGCLALHQLVTYESYWQIAAHHAFSLRRKGILVPSTDILIATIAMESHLMLVHADKHFEMIATLLPLKTVNVLKPGIFRV